MFCHNCGARVGEGKKFCTQCGAKLLEDHPEPPVPGPARGPEYLLMAMDVAMVLCVLFLPVLGSGILSISFTLLDIAQGLEYLANFGGSGTSDVSSLTVISMVAGIMVAAIGAASAFDFYRDYTGNVGGAGGLVGLLCVAFMLLIGSGVQTTLGSELSGLGISSSVVGSAVSMGVGVWALGIVSAISYVLHQTRKDG